MVATIKSCHPAILTEFVPGWIQDLGEDPVAVLEEYQSWGYALGSPDFDLPVGNVGPAELMAAISESGKWFANISLTKLPRD